LTMEDRLVRGDALQEHSKSTSSQKEKKEPNLPLRVLI